MSFNLNPKEVEIVTGMMEEITNSMIRIAAENDLIKDICERGKKEYEINPSVLKKAAKLSMDSQKKQKEELKTCFVLKQ